MRIDVRSMISRTKATLWGVAVVFLTSMIFNLEVLPLSAAQSDATPRNLVVIYYGNETTERSTNSLNHTSLLSVLRKSTGPLASKLAKSIQSDTRKFREVIERDSKVLLAAARRIGFDLAVFTNTLALDRKYLFYKHATTTQEVRQLPDRKPTSNIILQNSPLSRPESLRANLLEIASLYPPNSLEVVLITNSHGSANMALMPRVNTNLSLPNARAELAIRLEGTIQGDPPVWAALQGTSKLEYWKVISEVGALHGIHFPLVFRQACSSGLRSWAEFNSLPDNVSFIAHSAMSNMNMLQINYSAVFSSMDKDTDLVKSLMTELKTRDVRVNTKRTIWFWVLLISLGLIHPAVYFAPLVIWLIWFGFRFQNTNHKHP